MRVPLLMWGPGVVPGQDPRPVGLVAVNRALLAFGEGAGLGPLAGRIWRIGLMGENARPESVETLVAALRSELG